MCKYVRQRFKTSDKQNVFATSFATKFTNKQVYKQVLQPSFATKSAAASLTTKVCGFFRDKSRE